MESPPSGSPSQSQAGHYAFPPATRARINMALSPHVLVPPRNLLAPAAFAPPQRCAQLAHLADATHERALVDAYAKRTATLADEERAHQDRIDRVRAAAAQMAAAEHDKAEAAAAKVKDQPASSSTKTSPAAATSSAPAPSNTINYADFEAPQAPLDPWDAAEAANNGADSGKQDWQALQRVMMGHSAPVNRLGAGSQFVSTSSGPKSPTVPPRPDPNRVAVALSQVAPVSTHASGGGNNNKPTPSSLPGAFPTVTPPQSYATIPGAGNTPPPPNAMPMPLPMPSVHNPHPHPPAYHHHQPPPMHMPMPLPGVGGTSGTGATALGFGPHSMPRPGSNPSVNVMPGATPPLPPRNPIFVPPPLGTTPPPGQGMIGSPGQNRRPNKAPPPMPAGAQQGAASPGAASGRPSPRDLPSQFHPMFYSLLDMGFTPDSITLALHLFRDNHKRVTDFCLLYPSLPTPLPPRAAMTTAVHTLYNAHHPSEPDADTLRKHIVAFARIVDMGFAPDAAATALVVAKGNEQEAVETLMGS